jgi:hypothetical protein
MAPGFSWGNGFKKNVSGRFDASVIRASRLLHGGLLAVFILRDRLPCDAQHVGQ